MLPASRSGRVSATTPPVIDLSSSDSEGILHRNGGMLGAAFVLWRVADDDIFIRGHRQQDMDLESRSMPLLTARTGYRHPAGCDAMVVKFESLELLFDTAADGTRWIAAAKFNLK